MKRNQLKMKGDKLKVTKKGKESNEKRLIENEKNENERFKWIVNKRK